MERKDIDRVTTGGMLIAIGIIYGDIGTSPLYVMPAIFGSNRIVEEQVIGALSCVVWTLTLLTTVKYVTFVIRADNKGEGGILTLFALIRRRAGWLTVPAILGACAMLADGVITPPISVASAVEGLNIKFPGLNTLPIIISILTFLFLLQAFGTGVVGRAFGPIMLIWFSVLGIFGAMYVASDPTVLKALNPYYAYHFLTTTPRSFWLLGAIFLCTTGAEALYSDLGHCGRGNIRGSWVFVKTMLLLNYFGQGAWLIAHQGQRLDGRKPIFEIMPEWFLWPGIFIATAAAVIASQAMITGSYTLISEAIRLNFWPKVKLLYPSTEKGQLYVPSINWLLYAGCLIVVLYFRQSSKMEAAYGLAITMTMVMNTLLFSFYLYVKHVKKWLIALFFTTYIFIEGAFLLANLTKFTHGGWFSLLLALSLAAIMVIWLRAYYIKLRLTEFTRLDEHLTPLKELSDDISIPKYTTHLVFMTNASRRNEIENKVIYSIFQKRPKRADIYWFVHVDTLDDPYTMEYKVDSIVPNDVVKVTFRLGFRVEQRINLYFRTVVEDLVKNKEVDITSRYESLNKQNLTGDFRFVVLERFLSYENDLPLLEQIVMKSYFAIKSITTPEDKWFGLDSSSVKIEKVPLVIRPFRKVALKRV
ncbi:KUP/HAK/KT family potassium transporter [Ravibacter arvi]|uniref:Probable potassium transport system protein Kup n=1 Tax=Ravibacter arvi TaxID=2051041 RepID=A0ABP8LN43_9BACT